MAIFLTLYATAGRNQIQEMFFALNDHYLLAAINF